MLVWLFLGSLSFGFAQSVWTPSLRLEVSRTTVQVGDTLQAVFVVENGGNGRFLPPDWDGAGMEVLEGPNFSTEVVMRGDDRTYTMRYAYVLRAFEAGQMMVPPTTYKENGKVYFSQKVIFSVGVSR